MGPQEDYIETVVTCEGNYHDPRLRELLSRFQQRLQSLLLKDGKKRLILKKVEPWNSVRVTFNIPRQAALHLKRLAEQGSASLRQIGVLGVQIQGDRLVSLTLATSRTTRTEVILGNDYLDAGTPGQVASTTRVPDAHLPAPAMPSQDKGSPRPSMEVTRKNIEEYLRQGTLFNSVMAPTSISATSVSSLSHGLSNNIHPSGDKMCLNNKLVNRMPGPSSSSPFSTATALHGRGKLKHRASIEMPTTGHGNLGVHGNIQAGHQLKHLSDGQKPQRQQASSTTTALPQTAAVNCAMMTVSPPPFNPHGHGVNSAIGQVKRTTAPSPMLVNLLQTDAVTETNNVLAAAASSEKVKQKRRKKKRKQETDSGLFDGQASAPGLPDLPVKVNSHYDSVPTQTSLSAEEMNAVLLRKVSQVPSTLPELGFSVNNSMAAACCQTADVKGIDEGEVASFEKSEHFETDRIINPYTGHMELRHKTTDLSTVNKDQLKLHKTSATNCAGREIVVPSRSSPLPVSHQAVCESVPMHVDSSHPSATVPSSFGEQRARVYPSSTFTTIPLSVQDSVAVKSSDTQDGTSATSSSLPTTAAAHLYAQQPLGTSQSLTCSTSVAFQHSFQDCSSMVSSPLNVSVLPSHHTSSRVSSGTTHQMHMSDSACGGDTVDAHHLPTNRLVKCETGVVLPRSVPVKVNTCMAASVNSQVVLGQAAPGTQPVIHQAEITSSLPVSLVSIEAQNDTQQLLNGSLSTALSLAECFVKELASVDSRSPTGMRHASDGEDNSSLSGVSPVSNLTAAPSLLDANAAKMDNHDSGVGSSSERSDDTTPSEAGDEFQTGGAALETSSTDCFSGDKPGIAVPTSMVDCEDAMVKDSDKMAAEIGVVQTANVNSPLSCWTHASSNHLGIENHNTGDAIFPSLAGKEETVALPAPADEVQDVTLSSPTDKAVDTALASTTNIKNKEDVNLLSPTDKEENTALPSLSEEMTLPALADKEEDTTLPSLVDKELEDVTSPSSSEKEGAALSSGVDKEQDVVLPSLVDKEDIAPPSLGDKREDAALLSLADKEELLALLSQDDKEKGVCLLSQADKDIAVAISTQADKGENVAPSQVARAALLSQVNKHQQGATVHKPEAHCLAGRGKGDLPGQTGEEVIDSTCCGSQNIVPEEQCAAVSTASCQLPEQSLPTGVSITVGQQGVVHPLPSGGPITALCAESGCTAVPSPSASTPMNTAVSMDVAHDSSAMVHGEEQKPADVTVPTSGVPQGLGKCSGQIHKTVGQELDVAVSGAADCQHTVPCCTPSLSVNSRQHSESHSISSEVQPDCDLSHRSPKLSAPQHLCFQNDNTHADHPHGFQSQDNSLLTPSFSGSSSAMSRGQAQSDNVLGRASLCLQPVSSGVMEDSGAAVSSPAEPGILNRVGPGSESVHVLVHHSDLLSSSPHMYELGTVETTVSTNTGTHGDVTSKDGRQNGVDKDCMTSTLSPDLNLLMVGDTSLDDILLLEMGSPQDGDTAFGPDQDLTLLIQPSLVPFKDGGGTDHMVNGSFSASAGVGAESNITNMYTNRVSSANAEMLNHLCAAGLPQPRCLTESVQHLMQPLLPHSSVKSSSAICHAAASSTTGSEQEGQNESSCKVQSSESAPHSVFDKISSSLACRSGVDIAANADCLFSSQVGGDVSCINTSVIPAAPHPLASLQASARKTKGTSTLGASDSVSLSLSNSVLRGPSSLSLPAAASSLAPSLPTSTSVACHKAGDISGCNTSRPENLSGHGSVTPSFTSPSAPSNSVTSPSVFVMLPNSSASTRLMTCDVSSALTSLLLSLTSSTSTSMSGPSVSSALTSLSAPGTCSTLTSVSGPCVGSGLPSVPSACVSSAVTFISTRESSALTSVSTPNVNSALTSVVVPGMCSTLTSVSVPCMGSAVTCVSGSGVCSALTSVLPPRVKPLSAVSVSCVGVSSTVTVSAAVTGQAQPAVTQLTSACNASRMAAIVPADLPSALTHENEASTSSRRVTGDAEPALISVEKCSLATAQSSAGFTAFDSYPGTINNTRRCVSVVHTRNPFSQESQCPAQTSHCEAERDRLSIQASRYRKENSLCSAPISSVTCLQQRSVCDQKRLNDSGMCRQSTVDQDCKQDGIVDDNIGKPVHCEGAEFPSCRSTHMHVPHSVSLRSWLYTSPMPPLVSVGGWKDLSATAVHDQPPQLAGCWQQTETPAPLTSSVAPFPVAKAKGSDSTTCRAVGDPTDSMRVFQTLACAANSVSDCRSTVRTVSGASSSQAAESVTNIVSACQSSANSVDNVVTCQAAECAANDEQKYSTAFNFESLDSQDSCTSSALKRKRKLTCDKSDACDELAREKRERGQQQSEQEKKMLGVEARIQNDQADNRGSNLMTDPECDNMLEGATKKPLPTGNKRSRVHYTYVLDTTTPGHSYFDTPVLSGRTRSQGSRGAKATTSTPRSTPSLLSLLPASELPQSQSAPCSASSMKRPMRSLRTKDVGETGRDKRKRGKEHH